MADSRSRRPPGHPPRLLPLPGRTRDGQRHRTHHLRPLRRGLWIHISRDGTPEPGDYPARLAEVTGPWASRFTAFDATLDRHHPANFAHHHLAILAVHPDRQEQGTGSALLRAHHDILDNAGVPAYLDAAQWRTRQLYRRHGYLPSGLFYLPKDGPAVFLWSGQPGSRQPSQTAASQSREPGETAMTSPHDRAQTVAGSAVPRRVLGQYLRDLRQQAQLTVKTVASLMEWSEPKLWRIETGQIALRAMDVEVMCAVYSAPPDLTRALSGLARHAKAQGWWHSYSDGDPGQFSVYATLEETASGLLGYAACQVPALLRTEAYARTLIASSHPEGADTSELVLPRPPDADPPGKRPAISDDHPL